jgi:hypothetical protein
LAEPELAAALLFTLGLGVELLPPEPDAVMIEFADVDDVVMFEFATADRT